MEIDAKLQQLMGLRQILSVLLLTFTNMARQQ